MKRLDIYIDGSHLDKQSGNGRLGIGGVLVDLTKTPLGKNQLISQFSRELTPEYMKFTFGADKCSNPSAELTALLHALYQFKDHLKKVDQVFIHADYVGVRDWMTGAWKIKEPYIARIKSEIDSEIRKQSLTGKIQYEWVRGHQRDKSSPDAYWNSIVDLLAKGEVI